MDWDELGKTPEMEDKHGAIIGIKEYVMNIKQAIKEKNIEFLVAYALETGRWMIRRSKKGVGYNKFQWNPPGEWTISPDWDPAKKCGGGLHGTGPKCSGYYTDGPTVEFCLTNKETVSIDKEKIKTRRAMILLVNELPEGLTVGGYLDLEGTQITELPEGLTVGGSLYLRGTQITELPEGLTVGGSLYLEGTQITELPEERSVMERAQEEEYWRLEAEERQLMDYKNGTKPSHKESQIERGTCPNCGCDFKFLGKETDEEIRPMTPLEHQWMDFKKILSELVVFQEDYEEQTKDKCPGNQYYSDKLMAIVNRAKQAISSPEIRNHHRGIAFKVNEGEKPDGRMRIWIPYSLTFGLGLGTQSFIIREDAKYELPESYQWTKFVCVSGDPLLETDEEISLRMFEEWGSYPQGEVTSSFPDWLKER